jgi:Esterase-like activity of phytase
MLNGRAGSRRVLALLLGGLAALATHSALAAGSPRVLDVQAFSNADGPGGGALRELSGLDWDTRHQVLVAVSDRGQLVELHLDRSASDSATPLSARTGLSVRIGLDPRVNAESVVVQGSRRWLADEGRRQLIEVERDGTVVRLRPWPGALADPAAARSANSGVEALVHHPQHGLLALLQRPKDREEPQLHRLHGDNVSWALPAVGGGRASVKAAHLQRRQLRLLEKLQPNGGRPEDDSFWLTELDLDACAAESTCTVKRWPLRDPRLEGHNLEGLACVDERLCFLVSDSGPRERGADTLLVRVAWPAP